MSRQNHLASDEPRFWSRPAKSRDEGRQVEKGWQAVDRPNGARGASQAFDVGDGFAADIDHPQDLPRLFQENLPGGVN
jgi:hypothetical protein